MDLRQPNSDALGQNRSGTRTPWEFATWDVFVASDRSMLLNFAAIIACRIRLAGRINRVLPVTRLLFKSRTVI